MLVGVPTISLRRREGDQGRIFQRVTKRIFRKHGQSWIAHLSGQWGQAHRTIHDSQAFRHPAAFDGGQPSTASRPAPAAQPSWFQRNPLLAGIAGGLAGTWLGHMIFGATDTSARTTEGGEGEQAAAGAGSSGMLLLLMVMGGGALWWYMRSRRTPAPNFSGLFANQCRERLVLAESSRAGFGAAAVEEEMSSTDKAAFQQALIDIQTAWSHQDLAGLRRLVTPEMLVISAPVWPSRPVSVANRVEDVVLGRAEVRESWSEGATQYATVGLLESQGLPISLAKQPGEQGYIVEGNAGLPIETTEVWTFMRFGAGKWLLSAIQQVS